MTLAEYECASRIRRLGYRLYRNPLLMLLVGPSLVFLFERRFPQRGMTRRILAGVIATNMALVAGARLERACWLDDVPPAPGHDPGGRRGRGRLDALHPAPVRGDVLPGRRRLAVRARRAPESSYLQLPRPQAWAVGNANYHHVHHLSAKIPNYNLRAAHEEQPLFANTPVVTPCSSVAAFRLKLWDEERGCLRLPARRLPLEARCGRVARALRPPTERTTSTTR